jgi:hypothetical protein
VADGSGLAYEVGYACEVGAAWNGCALGTESLRLGVLDPQANGRTAEMAGECTPDENRGLFVPMEKVAEVGVLYPVGEFPPTV